MLRGMMESNPEVKKKRGRPKKPTDRLYSARVELVMRPEVKAKLQTLASAAEESLSAYMVRKGLGRGRKST